MDELHVDEGSECQKYSSHVGYIYGGRAGRLFGIPFIRLCGLFSEMDRAAVEDGFSSEIDVQSIFSP